MVRPDEVRPVRRPAGRGGEALGPGCALSTALRRPGSRAAPGREWVPRFQRKLWQVRRVSILHPEPLSWHTKRGHPESGAARGCGVHAGPPRPSSARGAPGWASAVHRVRGGGSFWGAGGAARQLSGGLRGTPRGRSTTATSGPRTHGSHALLAAARGRVARSPPRTGRRWVAPAWQRRRLGRRARATALRRGPGSPWPGRSVFSNGVRGPQGPGRRVCAQRRQEAKRPSRPPFLPKAPTRAPCWAAPHVQTPSLPFLVVKGRGTETGWSSEPATWRPPASRAGLVLGPRQSAPTGPRGLASQLVAASGSNADLAAWRARSPCQARLHDWYTKRLNRNFELEF